MPGIANKGRILHISAAAVMHRRFSFTLFGGFYVVQHMFPGTLLVFFEYFCGVFNRLIIKYYV